MPNQTPNYNLTKPLQTENYNIDVFNNNADIIDTTLKNIDSKSELKTLTLLNGWTALDKEPTVTKSGNAVILNMRISNGLFTEGSKIAETGYPIKGGNSIFNIFSMYDGSFNGSVYVDGNGNLICGSNIKSNNDTSINISWVTI